MKETDDFGMDVEFGKWLSQIRTKAGLSLKDAAKGAFIAEARLQALEVGYAERGIKKSEAEALSKLYGVSLQEILNKASS